MARTFLKRTGRLLRAFRVLPVAWEVRRLLRREANLPHLLSRLERGPVWSGGDPVVLHGDVGRALWLLGVRERGCVPRAMTLYALLSRQGRAATYVSGIRRLTGELDGHAWVEVNGVPVAEGNLAGITVQFRHDSRRSVP
ncbi:lasso peptide biosynthesis B2 protein [Deinococcus sp.]|uniref:lasso peptide biosynthesis B2 protein n=1 Tax=Deinococcus sp. TaxID=47478 RepID=UPI00391967F0